MRKLILALLVLVSTQSFAGPVPGAPAIPSLTVGGRVFTDLTNLIILRCHSEGTGALNATCRKLGASSGYTPSGSKAFVALAMRVNMSAAGATSRYYILSSTNDVGQSSATAYTGAVYETGSSSIPSGAINSVGGVLYEQAINFTVPNGSYLGIQGVENQALYTYVFGYEQ